MSSYNTITILGDGQRKEALASGAIYPGQLVERASATQFQKHGTVGGNAQPMFAVEDDLQGNGIDTVYANGSRMLACVYKQGDEVQVLLAEGENVSIGDPLESSGDGYLRKHTPPDLSDSSLGTTPTSTGLYDSIVAYAKEALDLSQSSGIEGAEALANQRLHAEIA